ncbi:MAG: methyltransferase domain-containing protein [Bacteroidota bacterium]
MQRLQRIAAKTLFPKLTDTNVGTHNEATRHQWMKETLKKIPAGARILDAGAGELRFKKYCTHLEYVSQDFGQYDGQGDQAGLQTKTWDNSKLDIVSDIIDIPVESESFDAIMCNEVLEHVPNPVAAIRELHRILKKEGYLILTAPFCSLTHFAPYHFSTGFSRYYYETHLEALGYDILDLHTNGNYFEYLAQELRRLPSVGDQYTQQKPDSSQKLALKAILSYLEQASQADQGSDELLCFGYQVFAQK